MPKKIKKTKVPKTKNFRSEAAKSRDQGINFSFKFYQTQNDKFSCRQELTSYWQRLLERLKALSGLSRQELLTNRSKSLRCHPIRWEDTTEIGFNLPNEDQLVDTPYQFSVSSNEYGRVHGFFIGSVFYIVWLDPNHLLYSS